MLKSLVRTRWHRATPLVFNPRRFVHAPVAFNWQDALDIHSLLTEDELAIQETAKAYCQERLLPRVLGNDEWLRLREYRLTFAIRCLQKRNL